MTRIVDQSECALDEDKLLTCEDFNVSDSLSTICSMNSCGTVIADIMKSTEELWVTNSRLSSRSVIFRMSGLMEHKSDMIRLITERYVLHYGDHVWEDQAGFDIMANTPHPH